MIITNLKVDFEQISGHHLSDECHVSFIIGTSFTTDILSVLMPKSERDPVDAVTVKVRISTQLILIF